MIKLPWLKVGAVAAFWAIVAGAAVSGWTIGRSEAARQVADLRQRLAADAGSKRTCAIESVPLDSGNAEPPGKGNLFGLTLGGILPSAPLHLHLREMLTSH